MGWEVGTGRSAVLERAIFRQGRNVLAVTTASHKTSHHVTAMLTAQLSSSSSKMLPVSWLSSLPSLLVQSATAN